MRRVDIGAHVRFETFLASAVLTILAVRSFLAVTGYPKVGGGNLHVAHVLWGGLLMAAAIVLVEVREGTRTRARASLIGGLGFGLFLDECGKFVTKDVNYFFRPAVAIMYTVFVLFFLVVRELALERPVSSRRAVAIGAEALADLALGDLTESGRQRALSLLAGTEEIPLSTQIRTALEHPGVLVPESRAARIEHSLGARLTGIFDFAVSRVVLGIVLGGQIVLLSVESVLPVIHALTHRWTALDLSSLGSALVADLSAVIALYYLSRNDLAHSLRALQRSVITSILLVQVLVFAREQFAGLLFLVGELALFALLRLLARTNQHLFHPEAPPPAPAGGSRTG